MRANERGRGEAEVTGEESVKLRSKVASAFLFRVHSSSEKAEKGEFSGYTLHERERGKKYS